MLASNVRQSQCDHCQTLRDPNLRKPCDLCGSRKYLFIGYSYQHEAKRILVTVSIIGFLLLAAVLAGIGYIVITQIQIGSI
jgi:hypothetical protein